MDSGDLEEQRRLLFVGITRVKSQQSEEKSGVLRLSGFKSIGHGFAKQLGITPAGRGSGAVSVIASSFVSELGLEDDQK
jgi:superfamily I DNA/RNA helicase